MSKKLVIKINNLEALDEDAITKKHEVEVLLWGRILAFAAAVVITVGGILALIFSQDDSDVEQGVLAEINSSQTAPAAGEAMPPQSTMHGFGESAENQLASGEKTETQPSKDLDKIEPENAMMVAVKPDVNQPGEGKPVLTSPQVKDNVKLAEESAVKPEKAAEPDRVWQPADIKLLDDGIVKAQLTHRLDRNKYPVDELGRVVSMKGESLIRVYLFTQLENLSGKTMYHSWYRNGDRMAKVRIPVIKAKYHASSSKFIDRFMLGDWQVKITDDDGKSYADVKFTVKGS